MECHMSFGHPLFIFAGGVHTLQVWPKNQHDYPLLTGGQEGWSQSYGSCGGREKSMVPVGSWEGKNGVTLPCAFKLACLYQAFSVSNAPLKPLFARYCTCVILRFGESAVHGGMTNKISGFVHTRLPPISYQYPYIPSTLFGSCALPGHCETCWQAGTSRVREPNWKNHVSATCWETFGSPVFVGMDLFSRRISSRSAFIFIIFIYVDNFIISYYTPKGFWDPQTCNMTFPPRCCFCGVSQTCCSGCFLKVHFTDFTVTDTICFVTPCSFHPK